MLPAISDSLTSGQPVYLLYSYANWLLPVRWFVVCRATQATGSVRLQVTARPPTTSGSAAARAAVGSSAGMAAARPAPSEWPSQRRRSAEARSGFIGGSRGRATIVARVRARLGPGQ